jgi:hypothetical protein
MKCSEVIKSKSMGRNFKPGAIIWDPTHISSGFSSFPVGGHVIDEKSKGGEWMCKCRYAINWDAAYVIGYE